MADQLVLEDRAELIAEGLGIQPSTYTGRTGDAVVAMALVAGYRRLTKADQDQVLGVVANKLHFMATSPSFFFACQGAIALMLVNPEWVPGSLSNNELEGEVKFWRNVSEVLKWLGFTGGTYLAAKGKDVLSKTGQVILDLDPAKAGAFKAVTAPLRSALTPNRLTGALIFGTAVKMIADSAVSDMEAEAARRGQLGSMTPLHAQRFGTPASP